MTSGPTILALETDSAWVVILCVSFVTLIAVGVLLRLIGRPGGFASGVLLTLPLALPLIAAFVFQHAVLPEIGVLKPAAPDLVSPSDDLLHLLLVGDGGGRVFTPYALTGSAGPWLLVFAVSASSLMLLRRLAGRLLISRLVRRCEEPDALVHAPVLAQIDELAAKAHLKRVPELLLLPPGMLGAFATGGRRARILLSEALIADLETDELNAVIAHEIAHIKAHDIQIVAVAGALRDLMAWNPFAHLAYRGLTTNRELEADRRAADLVGSPLSVASSLLKLCDLVRGAGMRNRAALAFLRPGRRVKRRISALLALADGRSVAVAPRSLPFVAAGCLAIVLGLQVGAQMAANSGGLAIMWGGPTDSETRTWGSTIDRGPVKASVSARNARGREKAARRIDTSFPEGVPVSFRSSDLPLLSEMVRKMSDVDTLSRSAASVTAPNWEAVPLVSEADSIGLYRLDEIR